MTDELQWTDVHTQLKNLYDDIDKEQSKLFTRAMSLKNKLHEIKELLQSVEHQISMQEANDDEKANAEGDAEHQIALDEEKANQEAEDDGQASAEWEEK